MKLARIGAIALGVALLCVAAGAIGGYLSTRTSDGSVNLSYTDFLSLMLTAISVLMTLLAFFIAILAVIGWTSIESRVEKKTEDFLRTALAKGGSLEQKLVAEASEVMVKKAQSMYQGVEPIKDEDEDDDS